MARIILAGGSPKQRKDLRAALAREGNVAAEAATGLHAAEEVRSGSYDVVILDSDIEGGDPCGVCRAIRSSSDIGIIVLTRDGGEQSRIDALNSGADDYLPGQFVFAELLARIRAIMRRVNRPDREPERIALRDRSIDLQSHKILGPGSCVSHLTPKEFLVLKHLIACHDKPVSCRDLAKAVWSRDGSGSLEYVRIVIGQLRRKIERDHSCPEYILTEHSVGYRFITPDKG